MKYVEIEKNLIPYRFDISLSGEIFTMEVHYNAEYDFFTVDLSKGSDILALGEKIVYATPLFNDSLDARFPAVSIMPLDVSGNSSVVTWDTLNVNVFLYVDGEDDA